MLERNLKTALTQFQVGELSAGAASELVGIDRYTFMLECKKYNIPVINYAAEDLQAELTDFRKG